MGTFGAGAAGGEATVVAEEDFSGGVWSAADGASLTSSLGNGEESVREGEGVTSDADFCLSELPADICERKDDAHKSKPRRTRSVLAKDTPAHLLGRQSQCEFHEDLTCILVA